MVYDHNWLLQLNEWWKGQSRNLENSQDFRDAIAFLIAVTILHEYTHLGDFVFGNHFWGELHSQSGVDKEEAGIIFETEVFGESVWRSNAGLILRNFKLD